MPKKQVFLCVQLKNFVSMKTPEKSWGGGNCNKINYKN